MRKNLKLSLILISTLLLTVLLAGCSSTSNTRSGESSGNAAEISKKDYKYDKLYYGTHNIEYDIHLENIVYSDRAGSIVTAAGSLIEELIYQNKNFDDYAAYLEKRFTDESAAGGFPLIMNGDGTQHIYQSSLTENYSIEFHDESFVIILYSTFYYNSGAAHGNYEFNYYIIDIAEQRLLTINDLIDPVPDSILKEFIMDKYGIDNYLRDNIWPPDTISINNEGVILLWNIYTITPYAAGFISIVLPDKTVNPYLTSKGKVVKAAM
ncbi:MAG: RsiV family protein [Treponema sp.]|nr:RsiV family protein [Treponema sp.]